MRRDNIVVFDGYIENTSAKKSAYSASTLFSPLGRYDQMAIMVVMDEVQGETKDTQWDLFLEHSADGINWTTKNGADVASGSGDISVAFKVDEPIVRTYLDGGSSPFLALVRLRFFFNDDTRAHVRIHATQRDQGN